MNKTIIILTLLFLLFGCGGQSSQPKKQAPNKKLFMNRIEESHVLFLQKPFGKNEVTINDKNGNPVRLAAANCRIYKPVLKEGIVVKWEVVLSPKLSYPWFTKCTRNHISINKEKYVEVFLGITAIGAGGCCADSGTFRTRNGIDWEKRKSEIRNKWEAYKETRIKSIRI